MTDPVTITRTPTYKVGPSTGIKTLGTLKAEDIHATDDVLIEGDTWLKGDVTVDGTLECGVLSPSATVYSGHLTADVTVDAGVDITAATGAEIFDYKLSTGAFDTGTGAVGLNGDVTIASGKDLTFAGGDSKADLSGGSGVFKTPAGAVTIGPGAVTISGAPTVATGKTLAVTDADKLTVGGIIVPQKIVLTVPINASSVDQNIFIADAAYQVVQVEEAHTVAGNDASPVTAVLVKCTGTQAPSGGTACTSDTFDLKGTANTVVTGTLSVTASDYTLADGNRLAIDFGGTLTTLAGGVITVVLKRV